MAVRAEALGALEVLAAVRVAAEMAGGVVAVRAGVAEGWEVGWEAWEAGTGAGRGLW